MAYHKIKKQEREQRLPVVAKLYKKGYSYSEISAGVLNELGINVSKTTIMKDVKKLLAEWREDRVGDVNDFVELELQRIDMACCELWEQWEKSKTDTSKSTNKAIGAPVKNGNSGDISTIRREKSEQDVICYGNPAYIAEIRQQLIERRKILGLYAPEKRELSGDVNTKVEVSNMTEDEIKAEIANIKKSMGDK